MNSKDLEDAKALPDSANNGTYSESPEPKQLEFIDKGMSKSAEDIMGAKKSDTEEEKIDGEQSVKKTEVTPEIQLGSLVDLSLNTENAPKASEQHVKQAVPVIAKKPKESMLRKVLTKNLDAAAAIAEKPVEPKPCKSFNENLEQPLVSTAEKLEDPEHCNVLDENLKQPLAPITEELEDPKPYKFLDKNLKQPSAAITEKAEDHELCKSLQGAVVNVPDLHKPDSNNPCAQGTPVIKRNIPQAFLDDCKKSFNISAGETGGGDAPFLGNTKVEKPANNNGMDMGALKRCLEDAEQQCSNNKETTASKAPPQPENLTMLPKSVPRVANPNFWQLNPRAKVFPAGVVHYSRKVFVGGLPPDIDERSIINQFQIFGTLTVDWPHKSQYYHYPPKGYCFLIFQDEHSVYTLINQCTMEEDKFYYCVSSPTIRNKPVQVRPWSVMDAVYMLDPEASLDPRKTVFIGGIPRPLKAVELAMLLDQLYGGVCYVGIDTDTDLLYPKGSGRVTFKNQASYIHAISSRFITISMGDADKRVEVKPYVLNEQTCDACHGQLCGAKFANYFCSDVNCLKYFCERCWNTVHARPGYLNHQPLVKEVGADGAPSTDSRWRSATINPYS